MGGVCPGAGNYSVVMKSSTWARDSHGLYDYESKVTTNAQFLLSGMCKVFRKGSVVEVKEAGEDLDRTEGRVVKGLANVGFMKGRYWVFDPSAEEPKENQEPLWLILRNYIDISGQPGIKLRSGDVIKFGRCKYLVKEIASALADQSEVHLDFSPSPSKHPDLLPDDISSPDVMNISGGDRALTGQDEQLEEIKKFEYRAVSSKQDDTQVCKICLGSGSREDNPLINSPCKCSGTMQQIHMECFKQWLRSKVTERRFEHVASYSWASLDCDICKEKYPDVIELPGGRHVELLHIDKPKTDYMILQTIHQVEHGQNHTIHVISLNKKETLRIGRANLNEVRINDISVSRLHAELRMRGGDYYLCDRNSKFGTLMLVKTPIEIKREQVLSLQAGKTIMSFDVPKSACPCSFGGSSRDSGEPTPEEIRHMIRSAQSAFHSHDVAVTFSERKEEKLEDVVQWAGEI